LTGWINGCGVDKMIKKKMHAFPLLESTCILHRIH
jgi:hypothetical protein